MITTKTLHERQAVRVAVRLVSRAVERQAAAKRNIEAASRQLRDAKRTYGYC